MPRLKVEDLKGIFNLISNEEAWKAVRTINKILKDGKVEPDEIKDLLEAAAVIVMSIFGLVGMIQDLTDKED